MDPVVRNRFRKSSTPRLLHFLFGNSLINRFTPYVLIPIHFYQCFENLYFTRINNPVAKEAENNNNNVLSSFVNIVSF